jgi:hypothetical protein
MDTDFLDWALATFSGYVAADELYDGPFCILSAVDNRCYKRILYEVLDHDPTHADIRAFLGRLKMALAARDLTLCGVTTDGSAVEYRCLQCGQGKHLVSMSCKSSLCLRCAKVYVDNWVSQVSRMLHEGVIYRHIILTVPAMFRTTFYQNAAVVLSALMRCGVQCLDDFYSDVRGKALRGGYIVVTHTHGRNGQYHPHLHLIATSGGYDAQGACWEHLQYLPYALRRRKWQWPLLTMLRQTLQTDVITRLVDACFTQYPDGLVTNVQKGQVPSQYQSLARYVAK